jgi:hypothetical protein
MPSCVTVGQELPINELCEALRGEVRPPYLIHASCESSMRSPIMWWCHQSCGHHLAVIKQLLDWLKEMLDLIYCLLFRLHTSIPLRQSQKGGCCCSLSFSDTPFAVRSLPSMDDNISESNLVFRLPTPVVGNRVSTFESPFGSLLLSCLSGVDLRKQCVSDQLHSSWGVAPVFCGVLGRDGSPAPTERHMLGNVCQS